MAPKIHITSASSQKDFEDIGNVWQSSLYMYREVGMDEVANLPPLKNEQLATLSNDGTLWVARDSNFGDIIVGYIAIDRLSESRRAMFLDRVPVLQMAVSFGYSRLGIGALLLRYCEQWASKQGYNGLVVMTFAGVPWGKPNLMRLGYLEITLSDMRLLQAHSLIKSHIADMTHPVLGMWDRAVMIKWASPQALSQLPPNVESAPAMSYDGDTPHSLLYLQELKKQVAEQLEREGRSNEPIRFDEIEDASDNSVVNTSIPPEAESAHTKDSFKQVNSMDPTHPISPEQCHNTEKMEQTGLLPSPVCLCGLSRTQLTELFRFLSTLLRRL